MSNRIRKVNELVRERVSKAILRNISKDYFVTVTAVETSRDMKHAIIWVSIVGDEILEKKLISELEEKRKEIQKEVVYKMVSKYTPILEFKIDHSGEHAQRIQELLNEG